jgi:quinoprotein glucose dehydrogenase
MLKRIGAFVCVAAALPAQSNWPTSGNDPGGTRYSPLKSIHKGNVNTLRTAWTYQTGALKPETPLNRKAAFEGTPIFIDGTLYLSTPYNQVIALDPDTGKSRWSYDPAIDRTSSYSEVTSRGVSSWLDPRSKQRRIFIGTIDARLIALDAASGRPCLDFGDNGIVDLTRGVRLKDRGDYQVTSPPAIIDDLVIVGSSIGDNRRFDLESGVVRAFDARTGKQRWAWDPLPDAGDTGGANAWAPISADPASGLVFIPTGSAGPDFFGGKRPGSNLYANSVVALRAKTGERVWHFQVVHHDLWDYDVAAQPSLITYQGKPAVAIGTKMGFIYVVDRLTGKPLSPVEERKVPASDVEGESAWGTQPFSSLQVSPHKFTPWGLTEEDRKVCDDRVQASRSEGIFTPPSLRGSILFPGNVGGINWGSMAWDRNNGLIIAASNRLATWLKLIPRDEMPAARKDNRLTGEFARQDGTPYGMYREILRAPSGLPCNAPPWGVLTAVDLAAGRIKWEVPLGVTKAGDKTIEGAPGLGGPIVTAGGLVFVSAARFDDTIRSHDVETGKVLWQADLPAGAQSTPMTFATRSGKQYVVICAGGHGKAGTRMGDSVVAFALP